jgi:hypothetical protein
LWTSMKPPGTASSCFLLLDSLGVIALDS